MAKLIREFELKKQADEQLTRQNCLELLTYMQKTVDTQPNVTGRIKGNLFGKSHRFGTNCTEFQNYVNGINNNPKNQIEIKIYEPIVDSIHTRVNLDNKTVTYSLSDSDNY
jgi:hypothetical protein